MLIKKHGIANIVWHGMASYWCHQWWCYTDVILVHCMMSRHVWCHIDALHGRLGEPKQICAMLIFCVASPLSKIYCIEKGVLEFWWSVALYFSWILLLSHVLIIMNFSNQPFNVFWDGNQCFWWWIGRKCCCYVKLMVKNHCVINASKSI